MHAKAILQGTTRNVLHLPTEPEQSRDIRMMECPNCRRQLARSDIRVYFGIYGSEEALRFFCGLCGADITETRELCRMLESLLSE